MGRASEAYLNAVEQALALKGQTQANAALQKGHIWGNFLNQIGQLGAQGVQAYANYEQDKKITALFTQKYNDYMSSVNASTPFVGPIDPNTPEGRQLAQMAELSPSANYLAGHPELAAALAAGATTPGAATPAASTPTPYSPNAQRSFNNLFPQGGVAPPIEPPRPGEMAGMFPYMSPTGTTDTGAPV